MVISYLPAEKIHIPQMLSISVEALPDSEDCEGTDFFLTYIRKNTAYVAVDGKKVVGYILFSDDKDKFIYLDSVAIHHAYRRKGIGTQLVRFVTNLCSDVKTFVRENNLTAQLFFKSCDFMVFETLHEMYESTSEDCYVFTLYAGVKE